MTNEVVEQIGDKAQITLPTHDRVRYDLEMSVPDASYYVQLGSEIRFFSEDKKELAVITWNGMMQDGKMEHE